MANGVYNKAKFTLLKAGLSDSSDWRLLLVRETYAFDADHNFVSDVVAHELSVSGYARQVLMGETTVEDDANDFAYLDANDAVFGPLASGQTVGGAILYKYNASDSAAELVGFFDLANTPTSGGSITVQWALPSAGAVLKVA